MNTSSDFRFNERSWSDWTSYTPTQKCYLCFHHVCYPCLRSAHPSRGKESYIAAATHYTCNFNSQPKRLFQRAILLKRSDGRSIVPHDIAQHRLGVLAQHGKLPAARQFGVGEMQRKVRQDDFTQSRIVHLDDETALFELRVIDQILAGLRYTARYP